MELNLNLEEIVSSIKKQALESGIYRDTMETVFDQLSQIINEIKVANSYHFICKGKWDVCEYLMSLIKSMNMNYFDMFLIVDVLMEAKPGSHHEILWNPGGALWYQNADGYKRYTRKFIVNFYEENGDSVPYLYEEV